MWQELVNLYMPQPTREDFKRIAEEYYRLWQFPMCIGSIDGKHCGIDVQLTRALPDEAYPLKPNIMRHFLQGTWTTKVKLNKRLLVRENALNVHLVYGLESGVF
nr:unnamed protein product [Callosobruchus analis]